MNTWILTGRAAIRSGEKSPRLTSRQSEVLALMARGYSNAAIARRLVISVKAVVQHTSQIYDRLDLFVDDDTHRRVHAVLHYLCSVPSDELDETISVA